MRLDRGLRLLTIALAVALLSWAWLRVPPVLTRGPYLQSASASGITLVCKTNESATLTLRYGERAGPPWTGEASSTPGTTHVFALDGLRPETRYLYELASGSSVLAGGAGCSFRTAPPEQSRAPLRFLAWGDSGTGDAVQLEVAARMLRVLPAPDFALGLGDLVYEDADWSDFDPKLFGPYRDLFADTVFWPVLGNHDVRTEDGAPYFDAFYLPTASGAPGLASGTEHYYSFDHGMAHFTCLDSQVSSSAPGSPMYEWAAADLAHARARGKRWLFAAMHHPPYTRGTHDSTAEADLIRLHTDLVPLFEQQGVDLVLTGHSHVYERSFLARSDAVLQTDVSEYTKIASPDGTVYLVTGCGGEFGSGPLDHPLMARAYGNVNGFSLLDVTWDEVRGRFVERDGRTTDLFTVRKAADGARPRVAAVEARGPGELALVFDEPVQPGAGVGGAEDAARYALDPGAAVLSATLDSDQSTVVLGTTPLEANRAYGVAVTGVADRAGHVADERATFVRALDPSLSDTTVVPRGATWRYFRGSSDPGPGWAAPGFDDSGWSQGPAGFGFGDGDDATLLADMPGLYASVYVRTRFQLVDPAQVSALLLRVNFDDGFVAFLNGSEVARARVPAGQTNTTFATGGHEAGTFEPFDLDGARALLVAGDNVLALEGHNVSLTNNDFSLHPELALTLDAPGGPPRAVITAEVHTANAPARLAFSGLASSADGPIDGYRWDFGDGSAAATQAEVEHLFTAPGIYAVTLAVRDVAGLEAHARVDVRVHDQGSAPLAASSAGATQVAPGDAVAFGAAGSRDPDGGALSFHWDFGDPASGASNVSNAAAPSHTFASAGTYAVLLVVTDDEGSSSTDTLAITVGGAGGPGSGSGGGGGGGCSITDARRSRGDPFLVALLVLALVGLARRRRGILPESRPR